MNLFEQTYDVDYNPNGYNGELVHAKYREIMKWALDHRDAATAEELNDVLCNVEFVRMDTYLIVGTMRGVFLLRDSVECWDDKLEEARSIIASRNQNADFLLRGLKRT